MTPPLKYLCNIITFPFLLFNFSSKNDILCAEVNIMGKEVKTNAVRILERNKIPYELLTYECDEFIDGIHSAEATGTPVAQTYKTLVMQGKSKNTTYLSFQLPKRLI